MFDMRRTLSAVLLSGIGALALAGTARSGPFDFLRSGKSRMGDYCDKMHSADANYDVFYEMKTNIGTTIYAKKIRGGTDVTQGSYPIDKICSADSVSYEGESTVNGRGCVLFKTDNGEEICLDQKTGVPLQIKSSASETTAIKIEVTSETPQPRQRRISNASITEVNSKRQYSSPSGAFQERVALFGNFAKAPATAQDLHLLYERFLDMSRRTSVEIEYEIPGGERFVIARNGGLTFDNVKLTTARGARAENFFAGGHKITCYEVHEDVCEAEQYQILSAQQASRMMNANVSNPIATWYQPADALLLQALILSVDGYDSVTRPSDNLRIEKSKGTAFYNGRVCDAFEYRAVGLLDPVKNPRNFEIFGHESPQFYAWAYFDRETGMPLVIISSPLISSTDVRAVNVRTPAHIDAPDIVDVWVQEKLGKGFE